MDTFSKPSNTVDLLKLFFSFCVVGIHTGVLSGLPPKADWYVMHMLFRLAVPFFFCASGYFLGFKLHAQPQKNAEILSRYRKKLYPPLLFWGTMGLINLICNDFRLGHSTIRIVLDVVRHILFYPPGAMWFIWACIVGAYLLQLVYRYKLSHKLVTAAALAIYLFVLPVNTYYYLLEGTPLQYLVDFGLKVCVSGRNGITMFLFLWAGYLLSGEKASTFFRVHSRITGVMLVCSYALLIVEVSIAYGRPTADDHSIFLAFIIFTPAFLQWTLQHNVRWRLPYRSLRQLSTNIYYLHRSVCPIWIGLFQIGEGLGLYISTCIACIMIWAFLKNSKIILVRKIL